MALLNTLLGFLGGIWGLATKVFDYFREKSLLAMGRTLEQGDLAKKEAEVVRQTSEILAKEVTKEETEKKLEDGTF
jgi:hypothetical protein